jgi:hypothetical protein
MSSGRFTIALCVLSLLIGAIPTDRAVSADRVLVVTTDWFSAGSLASLSKTAPWDMQTDLELIGSDAVARTYGGLIYIVNRFGADNIQVIDPAQGFQTIRQFSVGPGSNPQDIAFVSSSRAYVSRYETNDLIEVNPSTGEQVGTISLAEFADDDGLCEMSRMIIWGDSLLVQVQRMFRQDSPDPWIPVPPSYLAVIDLNANQLVDMNAELPGLQGIELAGLNPIAPIQFDPFTSDLLVLTTGRPDLTDQGGLERIDLGTMRSTGRFITEDAIGGSPIDFAIATREKCYIVASGSTFNTFCASFDRASGDPIRTIYESEEYVLTDLLVYPNGNLFLTDRDYFAPGVRVYDTLTEELIAGPLDTGLPPYELLVLPDGASGIEDGADLDSVIGLPFPNPSSGCVKLSVAAQGSPFLTVGIFDTSGRRVRTLRDTNGPEIAWDGLDQGGRAVPAGVYWIRMTSSEGSHHDRSVRILP